MNDTPRHLGPGLVLAVIGASGGSGASTLAAACAVRCADAGWSVALVDGDLGGGGIDVVLGAEHVEGVRWPDLVGVRGRVDGAGLLSRMPRAGAVAFLSHCRESPLWVGGDAVRGALVGLADAVEVLVLDVPRSWTLPATGLQEPAEPGDSAESADPGDPADALLVDLAIVVSGCGITELAGLAAAAPRVAARVPETHVVLRGRRVSRAVVADVERALDLPVLGVLDDDPSNARDVARGIPPGRSRGALAEVANAVVAALGVTGNRAAS